MSPESPSGDAGYRLIAGGQSTIARDSRDVDSVDDRPAVNILVPLFNYEEYIEDCLRSILMQSYDNVEIVIVDNASTDRSLERAIAVTGDDPRCTMYANDSNIGDVANFRRCYELSSAPLVRFLSADDRFASADAVAKLVAAFNHYQGVAIATSRRASIDPEGNRIVANDSLELESDRVIGGMDLGNVILTLHESPFDWSVMFRRSLLPLNKFDTIGGRRPSTYLDWIWTLNLLTVGDAAFVNEILTEIRVHEHQAVSTVFMTPESTTALYDIIVGACAIGYLNDPMLERQSLCKLVARSFLVFHRFDLTYDHRFGEMIQVLHGVIGRIAELSSKMNEGSS